MKSIGLYVKQDEEALRKADALEKWLNSENISVIRAQSYSPDDPGNKNTVVNKSAPKELFCVFVLGGDGTFLSASRWVGQYNIPLIGVKFGEVGFLAETAGEKLFSAARRVLENDYVIEERSRLLVKVIREEKEITRETVLNDVVINKGALARLADIETYINDHYLTTYRSDGLIVASPTGSTAYSLAAGGPIMHPEVQGIIINPICPFTLTNRCMILPNTVQIKIRLVEKTTDIFITFDGQKVIEISDKDTILISKSPHPVKIISFPDQNYFDILKTKLRWSGGRI
ncbi:MAG: NAD(+) kinase [Desulfobacteraceae bacterium]|nr:NAD(+)/NADH kinase [Desulfobacteraceae bacterium]MBC2757793.1 NAD(+) kinase [Desulfobacteraceae bacterium]